MPTLRTPKTITGPDLGIPSLTPQAWFEAKHGAAAWRTIAKISPEDWQGYLGWYRDVLDIAVENETEVMAIAPDRGCLAATLRGREGESRIHVRKIVLATGIDGSGRWLVPKLLSDNLPRDRYAHAADAIDFAALRGKRVGVLGAGASAFDNAGAALEAGAARVDLCLRRADIPRVNPFIWTSFTGVLGHYAELSDLQRWRFARHFLEGLPVPPPQDTFWRCRRFDNFAVHMNCPWHSVRLAADGIAVEAGGATLHVDFIIAATGVVTDLRLRPELAGIVEHIALWRDRFTPPPGEESELLGSHPYLGRGFEFVERAPGAAPFLRDLHNFSFGTIVSLGLTGGAVTGLRYGVPRLVNALSRDLFLTDADAHYRSLLAYDHRELATLDPPPKD